ncbi:hypothetical protein [Metabacillus fastidiosus]|uniref:hypothetical protein n=1 Tax=Metabacillus fastidiosus TaxID=1458 RepID=UPI003D27FC1B
MKLPALILGGAFKKQGLLNSNIERHSRPNQKDLNEKYFRPSKLPALNKRNLSYSIGEKDSIQIELPKQFMLTPRDTIINYFSILREAAHLSDNIAGGCGTVGMATLPYPVVYNFLTIEYQKRVNYKNFFNSFRNIGHINLVKLKRVRNEKEKWEYFAEIETIEGSLKGLTYFAYYYSFITIIRENDVYKIDDLHFYGEDFLCTPYHGWSHDAEAVVDIKYGNWCKLVSRRYPTVQNGYVKNVFFKGTDGNDYLFIFFELTNGTDIEIAQYRRGLDGGWIEIKIDPEKCLEPVQ